MEEFKEVDLLEIITADVNEDFGAKGLRDDVKKNKLTRTYLWISISSFLGMLIIVFVWKMLTGNEVIDYESMFSELLNYVAIGLLITGIIFLIMMIATFFSGGKESEKEFFRKINKVDLEKYFQIKMKNLTQGYIEDLTFEGEFIRNPFKFDFFRRYKENTSNQMINFKLENCHFSYGIVNSRDYVPRPKGGGYYVYSKQIFIVINFPELLVRSETKVSINEAIPGIDPNDIKIDFESKEFNERFPVYSKGEISPRKIFTPRRMQKMLDYVPHKNYPVVKYAYFFEKSLMGAIGKTKGLRNDAEVFSEIYAVRTKKELIDFIFKKVTNNCLDIFYVLKYFQNLDFF